MKRVLVVDADAPSRELVADLLSRRGYQVLHATTAEDALTLTRDTIPDLILMDLRLPNMDGLTASRLLKEDPLTRPVPIVAVTAHAEKGGREKSLKAGCTAFLEKPFETATLLDTVKTILGSSPTKSRRVSKIRILIINDEQLVREGIRSMLDTERQIVVVGEASSTEEALAQMEAQSTDVVLMDMGPPGIDAAQAIRRLKQRHSSLNIIVLASQDGGYLAEAVKAGAAGYLAKTATRRELVQAIYSAYQENSPLDSSLSKRSLQGPANLAKTKPQSCLSEREIYILQLIASGATTDEIASRLFVSQRTVKRDLGDIYDKLGVNERAHAVAEAYKRKLL